MFKDLDGNTKAIYKTLVALNKKPDTKFTKEEITTLSGGTDSNLVFSLWDKDKLLDKHDDNTFSINENGKRRIIEIKNRDITKKFQMLKTIEHLKTKEGHVDVKNSVWEEMFLTEEEKVELRNLLLAGEFVNLDTDNWKMKLTAKGMLLDYSRIRDNGIFISDTIKLRNTILWLSTIPILVALIELWLYFRSFVFWMCEC